MPLLSMSHTLPWRRWGVAPPNISHREAGAMTEIPLHWQTISELSRRIHNGILSPVELMEHLLNRVEALDGPLHSFRLLSRERAMAAARASELALRAGQDMGPLHGIPYAVKDLIDVQGLPTTAGSNLLLHISTQHTCRSPSQGARRPP